MRRKFLLSILASALAACAQRSSVAGGAIWIKVSASGDGYAYEVRGSAVPLAELDRVVLELARAEQPGKPDAYLHAETRIYVAATSPDVSYSAVRQAVDALSEFRRIGLVAEDRRG